MPRQADTPREKTIVDAIKKWLRAGGWIVWKNHGSAFSEPGLPDLMAVREGRFIAIECKRPGGRTTQAQRRWIRRLASQGVEAFVATSVEEVAKKVEEEEEEQ